jgi:hypothetical protein
MATTCAVKLAVIVGTSDVLKSRVSSDEECGDDCREKTGLAKVCEKANGGVNAKAYEYENAIHVTLPGLNQSCRTCRHERGK